MASRSGGAGGVLEARRRSFAAIRPERSCTCWAAAGFAVDDHTVDLVIL